MDAPQLGTAAITVICGILCLGGLLVGGVLLVVARSGIFGDLLSGLGAAAGRPDEELGQEGLFGEDTPDYRGRSSGRKRGGGGVRSAEEIRRQYDQQFNTTVGADPNKVRTPPPLPPVDLDDSSSSPIDPAKRRYKRRFSDEEAEFDDEIDSFIDDLELP